MSESVRYAETAEKIVETLDVHGWAQGGYEDENGKLCLLGGHRMARYGNVIMAPYGKYWQWNGMFTRYLKISSIADWNDEPGRTYGEVRDALLGFAKDLRNKGEK